MSCVENKDHREEEISQRASQCALLPRMKMVPKTHLQTITKFSLFKWNPWSEMFSCEEVHIQSIKTKDSNVVPWGGGLLQNNKKKFSNKL